MINITPAATTPEIVKRRFKTEEAPNAHGYTSAFYAVDQRTNNKYLFEVLEGLRPFYVVTVSDNVNKYIISMRHNQPGQIDIVSAEIYKNGSNYKTRREESPRLLKKYQYIACLLYGLIKNGEAPAGTPEESPETVTAGKPYPVIYYRINAAARVMILTRKNGSWIDAPAADIDAYKNEIRKTEPAASFTDDAGTRYVFRTYDGWSASAAIMREYTLTAATDEEAETIARAIAGGQAYSVNKAASQPEETPAKAASESQPAERQKRRTAYRVEARSPRGSWTQYAEDQPTREAAERIKEEAETRHTLTPDGLPIFYRIAQIDKGTEEPETAPERDEKPTAGETTTTPETAPTTAGSTPGEESPTAPENEPQRATETPKRPTDGAKPAEPGPVTDSGRTTAAKTTGAAPPGPNAPQEAPPNDYRTAQTGPPRHETSKAARTTTRSNKGPPRAKQDDKTSRTSETRINTDILRFLAKAAEKSNTCSPCPNFVPEFL